MLPVRVQCPGTNSEAQMGRQVTAWIATAVLGSKTHRAWLKTATILDCFESNGFSRTPEWTFAVRILFCGDSCVRPWAWAATSAKLLKGTWRWSFQRVPRLVVIALRCSHHHLHRRPHHHYHRHHAFVCRLLGALLQLRRDIPLTCSEYIRTILNTLRSVPELWD